MLVIGLIGEYAESEKWKKWQKVFEMLVIIGVAGELIADGGIFVYSGRLQTISDNEVASLNVRATDAEAGLGRAIADAESARATAKGFEQKIADSNARARTAEAQAVSASARIAEAGARAAEAQRIAEGERLARVKIEEKLAPRSLTNNDLNGLIKKMKPLGPQRIDFFLYPNDGEIMEISKQIASALLYSGWSIVYFQPLGGGTVAGMQVEFDPKDKTASQSANALVSALADCRLKVQGPVPSLPTPPSQLPPHLSEGKESIGATIRLTIGKK